MIPRIIERGLDAAAGTSGVCAWLVGLAVATARLAGATDGPPAPVVPHAVVVGETARPPHRTILLDGTGSTSTAPLRWKLLAYSPDTVEPARSTNKPLLIFDQQGRRAVYACILDPDPGSYIVSTVAIGGDVDGDGVPDIDVAITAVVVAPDIPVTPPAPVPTPTPPVPPPAPVPPTPVPAPVPTPTNLVVPPAITAGPPAHASLVLDSNHVTAAVAALRYDPTIAARMASIGVRWHTYDVASPDVARYGFGPVVAAAGGPPVVIVQDAAGHVLSVKRDFGSATGAAYGVFGHVKRLVP